MTGELRKILWMLVMVFVFAMAVPICARAQVVAPSGRQDTTDRNEIEKALRCSGSAELLPGRTYYLGGSIRIHSNETIRAIGAVLICTGRGAMITNQDRDMGYGSVENFTLEGGIWRSASPDGYEKTVMRIAHSSNIRISGAAVSSNYKGHSIELIGCRNVTIENCNLRALGSCPYNCVEEQLQIDLATPKTAPGIAREWGLSYCNGLPCKNIYVKNNRIIGGRALCCNFARYEGKYRNSFHKNIQITGNFLRGVSTQACGVFNTVSATIRNNKIKTTGTTVKYGYSTGLHIALFGKAPSSIRKAKIRVEKNRIYGGQNALLIASSTKSKYGKVYLTKNRLYSRVKKKYALKVRGVRKLKKSRNKYYRWRG